MLLSVTEFLGRFHPLVVHLPIGILLLAVLLQWLLRNESHPAVYRLMKITWLTGAASALLSAITGLLLSGSGDYDDQAVALHMWMGIAVVALSFYLCIRVFTQRWTSAESWTALLLLAAIVLTGHFGGVLTHGPDYLSAGWSHETAEAPKAKLITNLPQAQAYADLVQPILQSKCYSCHGPKKQKGRLRLDLPAAIEKGGKNGPVIETGNPGESELVKRVLLPKSDKHHMPPRDKEQVNEHELSILQWWIQQGAPYNKQVQQLQMPQPVQAAVHALQQSQWKRQQNTASWVPAAPVPAADTKAINALKEKGVVVLPVAVNSNYLEVNFVNAINFLPADMQLLVPLKKQLVVLKAGNMALNDSALRLIGSCRQLVFLQLHHTRITDKGLQHLSGLTHLRSLNLVGTAVTATGIRTLKPLQQLQSLYLFQTRVQKEEAVQLQKEFPHTTIDTGGYQVPKLPSDTTEVQYHKS